MALDTDTDTDIDTQTHTLNMPVAYNPVCARVYEVTMLSELHFPIM